MKFQNQSGFFKIINGVSSWAVNKKTAYTKRAYIPFTMPSQKVITQCLEWLYTQSSPVILTLKEFEKKYKKVKAMTSAQFKELIDYLVMEGVLEVTKCGSINVYYLYINLHMMREHSLYWKLCYGNHQLKQEVGEAKKQQEQLIVSHKPGKSRDEYLLKYKSLMKEMNVLETELNVLTTQVNEWNGEEIQRSLDNIENAKVQLSKHADNIENLIVYISKEYNVTDEDIRREFEIPEEFNLFI